MNNELPTEKIEQSKHELSPELEAMFAETERLMNEPKITNEERIAYVEEVLGALKKAPGQYFENIGDLYQQIHEELLVRREHPEKAFRAVLEGEDVSVQFNEDIDTGEGYANATHWMGLGDTSIQNPFIEGHSHIAGVVTVMGFKDADTIVENRKIKSDGRARDDIDYGRNTSISGVIPNENIRFLVTRIPMQGMPEEELTLEELDARDEGKPYVFRGLLFDKEKEKGESHETPS